MKRALDGAADTPLTEPVTVACEFVTGGAWEVSEGSARWVGWVELPYLGGETRERRIVSRLAMSKTTARRLHQLLGNMLDED